MSRRTAESKVGELVSQTTGAVVAVVVRLFHRTQHDAGHDQFDSALWDNETVTPDEERMIAASQAETEPSVAWAPVKAHSESRRSA